MSQTRGSLFELFHISSRFTVGENDIDGYGNFFIVGGENIFFGKFIFSLLMFFPEDPEDH